MISGTRLAGMLDFNRAVVQDEIVKISSRLVETDRKLNAMRIEEALAWRRYAIRAPAVSDDAVANGRVAEIFDRRVQRAESRMQAISEADIALANLEKRHAEASSAVNAARAALAESAARLESEIAGGGFIANLDKDEKALLSHAATISRWADEAKSALPGLLGGIEASRPFAYLRRRGYGTDSPKGRWPWRSLDAWLAKTIDFEGTNAAYEELKAYPSAAGSWKAECDAALARVMAEKTRMKDAAVAGLDAPRRDLAECLNGLDEVEARIDLLVLERAEAMMHLLDVALGRDREYQTMVDTFVRLLSKEKAAAMVRLSVPGESRPGMSSAEVDLIVKNRILLSMESDGLRRHLSGAERRFKAIEEVQARLALRKWNSPAAAFSLDERTMLCHDLSTGRMARDEAWTEIERGFLGNGGPAPGLTA